MLDVVGSYKLRVASYGLSICHQILRYGLDLFELASLVLSRGGTLFFSPLPGGFMAGIVVRQLTSCELDEASTAFLKRRELEIE